MTGKTLSLSDVLTLSAATVAIGTAVFSVWRWGARVYRRTIGSRRDLVRRINQLAAGVTVRYVEERFGAPVFARAFDLAEAGGVEGTGIPPLRELIYGGKHAWIQVLADSHDAVVRISVTATDPRFHFNTRHLTSQQVKVKLGRSHFAQLDDVFGLRGRSLRIGAHNFEYAEAYWGANPGGYQWFVLSYNDAGAGKFDLSPVMQSGIFWHQDGVLQFATPSNTRSPAFDASAPYARQFRSGTVINTVTVLGPLRKEALLTEPRGPDSNQVRVLVPGMRQRWQIRWRMRYVMRQAKREARRQQALEGKKAPA